MATYDFDFDPVIKADGEFGTLQCTAMTVVTMDGREEATYRQIIGRILTDVLESMAPVLETFRMTPIGSNLRKRHTPEQLAFYCDIYLARAVIGAFNFYVNCNPVGMHLAVAHFTDSLRQLSLYRTLYNLAQWHNFDVNEFLGAAGEPLLRLDKLTWNQTRIVRNVFRRAFPTEMIFKAGGDFGDMTLEGDRYFGLIIEEGRFSEPLPIAYRHLLYMNVKFDLKKITEPLTMVDIFKNYLADAYETFNDSDDEEEGKKAREVDGGDRLKPGDKENGGDKQKDDAESEYDSGDEEETDSDAEEETDRDAEEETDRDAEEETDRDAKEETDSDAEEETDSNQQSDIDSEHEEDADNAEHIGVKEDKDRDVEKDEAANLAKTECGVNVKEPEKNKAKNNVESESEQEEHGDSECVGTENHCRCGCIPIMPLTLSKEVLEKQCCIREKINALKRVIEIVKNIDKEDWVYLLPQQPTNNVGHE